MKTFKPTISLARNSRGCYILDTVKGCSICKTRPGGCYGECYASKIAYRYRMDFSNPVTRQFEGNEKQLSLFGFANEDHIIQLRKSIKRARMPFVRIGEMGDPSEDWEHTSKVHAMVKCPEKATVIMTKHWHAIPDELLPMFEGVYVNTSISALDSRGEITYRLGQYARLKEHCKSILRIVSCEFDMQNREGRRLDAIQRKLFDNDDVIDTVFRPNPMNALVVEGVIKIERMQFLGTVMYASVRDKSAYLGRCETCPDMCGMGKVQGGKL